MRSHNDEHSDVLPVIDISALKHVAYIFDALIYYLRSGTDIDTDVIRDGVSVHSWQDPDENENEEHEEDPVNQSIAMETDSMDGESDIGSKSGRKHPFFQRSDSTTFLGCPPPDPFQRPLVEALPLADQPHRLQPSSRKEDLFGFPRQPITAQQVDGMQSQPSPFDRLPTHLALSMRAADMGQPGSVPVSVPVAMDTTPSAPTLLLPTDSSSSATPSVIVRPSTLPTSATAATAVAPPSETISQQSLPISIDMETLERAGVHSERPLVSQPSVIVHASSAHPIIVPSVAGVASSSSSSSTVKPSGDAEQKQSAATETPSGGSESESNAASSEK